MLTLQSLKIHLVKKFLSIFVFFLDPGAPYCGPMGVLGPQFDNPGLFQVIRLSSQPIILTL